MGDEGSLTIEQIAKWRVRRRDIQGLERLGEVPDAGGISKKSKDATSGAAERVGKGHFGEVVKARLKDETVVVKVSRTSKLDERRVREAREDLENECRILTGMGPHHHVVELRGVVFEDDPPFLGLVLAFYPLGSMKNVFKEQVLPLRTKVKVLYGIGLGIAYLHKNGVEHRDLWPANVLLDADFTAKLADFGLAITRQSRKIPNKCQFRWSSPQRCANHLARANRYDAKNDVWSFGMICYWALTGEKPYKNVEKGNEVRFELERGAVPRFPKTTELPHALIEAIQLCWVFNSHDRPPMAEVCGRLARVLERDSERLGDDHPDAGPVDRTAWRALMPGTKRDSTSASTLAASRESSHAIRLRALDADIELLTQRRAALQEHFKLVNEAPDAAKSKKAKKLLEAERATIAQRMEAEIAALDAEIEHKTDRRVQLVAAAAADTPASSPTASAAAAAAAPSSSSSGSHRHRRNSNPSKVTSSASMPAVRTKLSASATPAAINGADDEASTSASDDGKPQPLGAYTRAVVATRDEPAQGDGGLALAKGAQIYLLHRGATSDKLEGVDVASDKRGTFAKAAVRGVSRHKEEEIARAFGLLRKRKRAKNDAAAAKDDSNDDDGSDDNSGNNNNNDDNDNDDDENSSSSHEIPATQLPEPIVFQRRESLSADGSDRSYADAESSERAAESSESSSSSTVEHHIETRVRVVAVMDESTKLSASVGMMSANDDRDEATCDDEEEE